MSGLNISCPPGFHPDSILYLSYPPLFSRGIFDGCDLHIPTTVAVGGLTVANVVLTMVLNLVAACLARNAEARVALLGGAISSGMLLPGLCTLLDPALYISGRALRWFTLGLYVLLLGLLAFPTLFRLMQVRLVRALPQSSSKAMQVSAIRRDRQLAAFMHAGSVLATIAAAATFALAYRAFEAPLDPHPDAVPFQVASIATGLAVACFMFAFRRNMIVFVRGARDVVKGFSELGSQADKTVEANAAKMRAFLKRSEAFGMTSLAVIPVGSGVWLVGAVVLPMFWWLYCIHALNHCSGYLPLGLYLLPPKLWNAMPCISRRAGVAGQSGALTTAAGSNQTMPTSHQHSSAVD